jgi:pilus assembly protein CpaB
MLKQRGFLLVVVSLGLGGIAAMAANGWVNDRLNAKQGGSTVVVAATDIQYGTKVEGRHLRVADFPPEGVPESAFRNIEEVVGSVATVTISKGEVLVQERFAEHSTGSTLAALVTENMRAVTIRVDDVVGVAGFLLPGNRVDVLSTRKDRKTKRARTETILRDLKVLAVDQTAATQKNEPIIVRAVTLEMTPQQSEELVRAKEEGTIQLTLRNPLEQRVADVPEPAAKRAPAVMARQSTGRRRPRSTTTTVTVIRGTHVNTQKAKG